MINVVLIYTPSLTVGSFAVEGLVDPVLSLSDGLGEELVVNFGTNQSLHFSILKGDITGILRVSIRTFDFSLFAKFHGVGQAGLAELMETLS